MRCHQRAIRAPALGGSFERLVGREPVESSLEPQIGGRKGVGLAEPERDVVRRPRAEPVEVCQGCDEPVEREATVEAHPVFENGAGQRADRIAARGHESDGPVVGCDQRRR